jgi:hypothetical protein
MRRMLWMLALILVGTAPHDVTALSFVIVDLVIVAHGDDWQLFAGDKISERLRAGHRVVFVQLTRGVGNYLCWERGFLASAITAADKTGKTTQLSCDLNDKNLDGTDCSEQKIQGHLIYRCRHGNNIRMNFLRLPGTNCPYGCGGELNGVDHSGFTLLSLALGQHSLSPPNAPPDAAYTTWAQLVTTVELLYQEAFLDFAADAVPGEIFSNDPRGAAVARPYTDHLDHVVAGCLAVEIFNLESNITLQLFSGYNSLAGILFLGEENALKHQLFVDAFGGTVKGDALGTTNLDVFPYTGYMQPTQLYTNAPGTKHEDCQWMSKFPFAND